MAPNAERIPSGTLAQPEWGKLYGYGTCKPWSITACTLSDRSMVTIAPTMKIGHEVHSESLFIRKLSSYIVELRSLHWAEWHSLFRSK